MSTIDKSRNFLSDVDFFFNITLEDYSLKVAKKTDVILSLKLGPFRSVYSKPFSLINSVTEGQSTLPTIEFKASLPRAKRKSSAGDITRPTCCKRLQILATHRNSCTLRRTVIGEILLDLSKIAESSESHAKFNVLKSFHSQDFLIFYFKVTPVSLKNKNKDKSTERSLAEVTHNPPALEIESPQKKRSSIDSLHKEDLDSWIGASVTQKGESDLESESLLEDKNESCPQDRTGNLTQSFQIYHQFKNDDNKLLDQGSSELVKQHTLVTPSSSNSQSKYDTFLTSRVASNHEIYSKHDDPVVKNDRNGMVSVTNDELEEIKYLLERKTTTVVELQKDMYESIKHLEIQLSSERLITENLRNSLHSLREEKEKELLKYKNQLAKLSFAANTYTESVTQLAKQQAALDLLSKKNSELQAGVDHLSEKLRSTSNELLNVTNLYNEEVANRRACGSWTPVPKSETPPTPTPSVTPTRPPPKEFVSQRTVSLSYEGAVDTDEWEKKVKRLQDALSQAHDYQNKLNKHITLLESRQLELGGTDSENMEKIRVLEQNLIETKLQLVQLQTDCDGVVATYENKLKKLTESNNHYVDLTSKLQAQIDELDHMQSKKNRTYALKMKKKH